jgi:phosphoserine phosphatase
MKRISNLTILLAFLLAGAATTAEAQTYHSIPGWSAKINSRIENFLNATLTTPGRKVAVFDGDGTVFGQAPYYLADEALYAYADDVYKGRTDKEAKAKLAILDAMVENGDNVGKRYVEDRVHFLSGLTVEEIEEMGVTYYRRSYPGKMYPEMKALIANLQAYGFEVWILTASPELLYQKFLSEELNIPVTQVVGAKCVVKNGRTVDEIIFPIPQDDGKAASVETFIKARPLIVGGNSRGDMDMINLSQGLKIVVNPDDETVRGAEDGPMSGHTVKSYWEKEGALIVKCNDVPDPNVRFHTTDWKIRTNKSNPKQ